MPHYLMLRLQLNSFHLFISNSFAVSIDTSKTIHFYFISSSFFRNFYSNVLSFRFFSLSIAIVTLHDAFTSNLTRDVMNHLSVCVYFSSRSLTRSFALCLVYFSFTRLCSLGESCIPHPPTFLGFQFAFSSSLPWAHLLVRCSQPSIHPSIHTLIHPFLCHVQNLHYEDQLARTRPFSHDLSSSFPLCLSFSLETSIGDHTSYTSALCTSLVPPLTCIAIFSFSSLSLSRHLMSSHTSLVSS